MLKPDLWVHVPTKKASVAVQAKAFKLGYKWARMTEQHPSHLHCPYLHLNPDGNLTLSFSHEPSIHTVLITTEEFLTECNT